VGLLYTERSKSIRVDRACQFALGLGCTLGCALDVLICATLHGPCRMPLMGLGCQAGCGPWCKACRPGHVFEWAMPGLPMPARKPGSEFQIYAPPGVSIALPPRAGRTRRRPRRSMDFSRSKSKFQEVPEGADQAKSSRTSTSTSRSEPRSPRDASSSARPGRGKPSSRMPSPGRPGCHSSPTPHPEFVELFVSDYIGTKEIV
jgi:hypothetical protein